MTMALRVVVWQGVGIAGIVVFILLIRNIIALLKGQPKKNIVLTLILGLVTALIGLLLASAVGERVLNLFFGEFNSSLASFAAVNIIFVVKLLFYLLLYYVFSFAIGYGAGRLTHKLLNTRAVIMVAMAAISYVAFYPVLDSWIQMAYLII